MPSLTDEQTRRNVIREWILGFPRDTIAEQNNIDAGTVSSIVASYKVGLEELDFDSIRQLAVEARQHGLNFADLALHFRMYNYFVKSGAAENKIESFIGNASSSSPEKVIELVHQLHEMSKSESIPLDEIPGYIKEKLQEKEKIDQDIEEADAILQNKNVIIEAINEHTLLKEELKKYRLSIKDIRRLLDLLGAKLRSVKALENKEIKLKNNCEALSKQAEQSSNFAQVKAKLITLAKLKSYGLTEDRLQQLNNLLRKNEYKDKKSSS